MQKVRGEQERLKITRERDIEIERDRERDIERERNGEEIQKVKDSKRKREININKKGDRVRDKDS